MAVTGCSSQQQEWIHLATESVSCVLLGTPTEVRGNQGPSKPHRRFETSRFIAGWEGKESL